MSDIKPWRILESRETFKDKYLSVRSDRCARADGHIIEPFHIIEAQEWVNVVALTETGNIVLIREYRHGAQQVTTGLPGGTSDPGETDIDGAAKRELLEETGYACDHMICVGRSYANWATHDNQVSHYLGFGAKKIAEQKLDMNEEIEVFEKPYAEFLENYANGAQHSLHAANLFYAEQYFAKNPERRLKWNGRV